jgi:hypothetical protein
VRGVAVPKWERWLPDLCVGPEGKFGMKKLPIPEPGLHESQVAESKVIFVFDFSPEEAQEPLAFLKSKLLSLTYAQPIVINDDQDEFTLEEFCKTREGLYIADVLAGSKYSTTWTLDAYSVNSSWRKVSASCPADFATSTSDSSKQTLKDFTAIDTSTVPTYRLSIWKSLRIKI